MLDYQEYTIELDHHQDNGNGNGNSNGYNHLEGDWLVYYKVASRFTHKVKPEDKEDFLHDLFLAFARVKTSYDAKGKELTEGGLVRIAQYEVADYWRAYFKRANGIECSRCSKAQKAKCKEWNYSAADCPKAIQMEQLSKLIEDGQGGKTELYQLIADDNADFIPRLEAQFILESYPKRFVDLAYKKYAGYRLTDSEAHYCWREQKRARKKLIEVS
jgi:hypothetical protein